MKRGELVSIGMQGDFAKLGAAFGSVGDETMLEVARSLAVFLGIAN